MDFIPIMGDGITQLIRSFPMKNISLFSKCGETIYRLLFRTLTSSKLQASGAVDEWIPVLKEFFQLACTNKDKKVDTTVMTKLNDLKAYINGSFAMNTLPERRKTAFAMIEVLMEVANHLTKLVLARDSQIDTY